MKSSTTGDPITDVLARVGRSSPGQEITIVKQLAVLAQIEKERPDWAADATLLDLIANQTGARRESELELALDLQMSPRQLTSYYGLVTRLDALQTTTAKTSAIRSFQSSFALLRQMAKTSSQPPARISELIDLLLALDPLSSDYGPRLVAFVRQDLLSVDDAVAGAELENKLIEALTTGKPVDLPSSPANIPPVSKDGQSADANWQFDLAAHKQDQIKKFLGLQKYTHFAAVADAFAALAKLRTNPGAADELAKLKSAVDAFIEPEREPEPKKKKSKQPVVVELTLKETVARLSTPVSPGALDDVRSRMGPAVGEGLLGYAYAVFMDSMNDVSFSLDLVRKHDFETAPWREAKVDGGRVSGSLGRLSQALARLQARSIGPSDSSAFFTAMLGSAQLVDRRLVTRRAEEYVARTMDLGEEVLALSFLADQTAAGAMSQIDILTTARRANQIKSLVERGEIAKALRLMAPSESYALGQAYFNQRLGTASASKFVDEPGALGAMARVISQEQGKPAGESLLASEIRQFGMPTTTRTGLSRLDLIEPEPFEHCSNFLNDDRLAERIQDLKLATIRRLHRLGGDPMLPVSSPVLRDVSQGAFAEMRKSTSGTNPPGRDWSSVINTLQGPNDLNLATSIMQVSKSAYVRSTPRSKWDQR
jgi:hypothetical protein